MCRVKYMRQKKPEKASEVIPEDDSFGRRIIDLRTLAQSFWCNHHGFQPS